MRPAGAADTDLRRTPLHAVHRRLGARMVEFGGWDMPVQYSGILEEHRAVRTRAGLFDVSHMGEVEIRGPAALDAVQRLVTNDAARLADGDAQYAVMCVAEGGIVDDLVYARLAADRFLLTVNASNRERDVAWMREHAGGAEVIDRSDELALLALQGPLAARILEPLTEVDVARLAGFHVAEARVAGRAALLSRTGYTGEDGFEIYVDAAAAAPLWDALVDAGAPRGLLPAGLGARDTLRLEAGLLLYGNDIDATTTPLEAGLGRVVKLDKGEFVGREALARQKREGVTRRLVGIEMETSSIPRHGYPLYAGGERVGVVTSGTKSPTLGRGIALGYVSADRSAPGGAIEVEIRGRMHAARVVRPPFVPRGRPG